MAGSTTPKKRTPKKATQLLPENKPLVPSSAADFRRKRELPVIGLPSGMGVRVRRPGIQEFMASGIMPDALMPIIQQHVNTGQVKSPAMLRQEQRKIDEAMAKAISDPRQVAEMMRAMQRIAASCWIEPRLAFHEKLENGEWATIPESERDLETYLYTDEVDIEDITFTFNYAAGGTEDTERFHHEAGERVGAILGIENLELPTE